MVWGSPRAERVLHGHPAECLATPGGEPFARCVPLGARLDEGGGEPVRREASQRLELEPQGLVESGVLGGGVGAEQGRVVGRGYAADPGFEERRQGMRGDRGHDAQRHIGGRADLEHDALARESLHECRWRILPGRTGAAEDRTQGRRIELGRHYAIALQVETVRPGATAYRVKLWPVGDTEPPGWDLELVKDPETVERGSALIVAHNTDVTIGDVTAVPLRR